MLDTNIKILERAKMYIEQLSQGVDPITGDKLPDETVLNNERINRCLSYVAEVLELLISHGGIEALANKSREQEMLQNAAAQSKAVLPPFELSPAQRQSVYIADKPLDVSTFTRNINNAIDTGSMQKLKGTVFAVWLLKKGFLERDGNTKKPTPIGSSIGIIAQVKQTNQLMYSREAQQFLLDNIDEIIAM